MNSLHAILVLTSNKNMVADVSKYRNTSNSGRGRGEDIIGRQRKY